MNQKVRIKRAPRRRIGRLVLFGVVLGTGSSCLGLDVVNLNDPDRERALLEPGDVEALIGGTFSVYFSALHGDGQSVNLFPVYATEMSGVPVSGAGWPQGVEPRIALENSPDIPGASGAIGPRNTWNTLHEVASSIHDGLRTLDGSDITIWEGDHDVTPRARAFAKFMQGAAWGQLAILYDQAVMIPEAEPLRANAVGQAIEFLTPWEEGRELAIQSLESAIAIAQQHSVTFPSRGSTALFFTTPQAMSTEDFTRLASTMAARILVLSARTPQQRAEVDWDRVLQYTANGLTGDFETVLEPGFRSSTLYARAQDNSAGCSNCFRLDNRLFGPADASGAYQTWLNNPVDLRNRFEIVTDDRRLTGPTPTSDGAYTWWREDDNGFPAGRGLYRRSAYQWAAHDRRGFTANTGTARLATADENNLLRAEALIHTGDLGGAAALINITRTRSHTLPDGTMYDGLPAVTAVGVPEDDRCVPRTDDGACGDLLTALRYERMLELAVMDTFRGYADSRGFGILPDGSWLQLPVTGTELEVLGLPSYTYGGVGGEWAAVYDPVRLP